MCDRSDKIHDSVLDLIGDTPMVRLASTGDDLDSEILVKLEYMNPTGSIKDRIALEMIEQAEENGDLKEGDTIIESSTGNTGISLASVGRMKGYDVVVYETLPGKAGHEKTKLMRNIGCEVKLLEPEESPAGSDRSVAGAEVELPGRQICLNKENEDPDIWWARQFSNEYNTRAHNKTGQEILNQTSGELDVFVASIGTGGTLYGVAETLKNSLPDVRIVGIQPQNSRDTLYPGMEYEATETKGGIIAEMLTESGMIDEIVRVTDDDAREMTHHLWKEEGLYAGVSSGANVYVALEEARKSNSPKRIVTVLPDRIDRYITEERFVT